MNELNLFVPICKIDEEQRLVYGILTEEVLDKAGEIFDYASSKPYFEKWSGDISKATDGKSLGNVRVMHTAKVAGKLTDIDFDDANKRVSIVAKVIDDGEWKMCLEGGYTGFSQGGKYVRRWAGDDGLKRYTANPSEASLVDNPCLGTAHFELIKADGMSEQREFVQKVVTYAPTNDEVKALAETMAKAAGKTGKANDFLTKAREQLIADHIGEPVEIVVEESAAEVEKVSEAEPVVAAEVVVEEADGEVIDPAAEPVAEKVDLADALTSAVEKAATVAAISEDALVLTQITPDMVEFGKGLAKLGEIAAADPLAKGLYTVSALARLIDQLASIQAQTAWETEYEGDNSKLPQELATSVQALGASLVAMASEEVAELLAEMNERGGDVVIEIVADDDGFAYAQSVVDLVKADTDLMEKAGARHSKKDMAAIQAMHDSSAKLGAKCDSGNAEKAVGEDDDLTKALAANAKLNEAVEKALPAIETLTKGLEDARAEIDLLKAQPMPTRVAGSVHAVTKGDDASPATAPVRFTEEQLAAELAKMSDHDRAMLLTKAALRLPMSAA